MLILVIILAGLHYVDSYLAQKHQVLEKYLSKLIQQPVTIKKVTIGSSGLEPILRFNDVVVFDAKGAKKLLQAREIQIGIDLINSLLKWRPRIGLLLVRGVDFFVYQDKSGVVQVYGTKVGGGNTKPKSNFGAVEILPWVLAQNKIELSDVALTWRLASGEILRFNNLHLKLYRGLLQHDLKLSGNLQQWNFVAANFLARLKLRGDVLRQEITSLSGDVVIGNWDCNLTRKFTGGDFFLPITGDVNLSINNSRVKSKIFRQPLVITALQGRVLWQHSKDGSKIRVSRFKCNDAWLSVRGDMQFLLLSQEPSVVVDMQLDFNLSNLAKAKLYYPVTLLPPSATLWLDTAFVSSKAMNGSMILQGPIAKFPFDHDEGQFLVNANIRDVYLNYDDAWPPVKNIDGKMIFAKRSMTILTQHATIMHTPVKSIKAVIPDLDLPVLHIDSSICANSSVGLQFVRSSPLKKTVGRKLHDLRLTGPMQLLLTMAIPLSELVQQKTTQVAGDVTLHDNLLRISTFAVENIQGKLHFTEDALLADKISGRLFARPVFFKLAVLNSSVGDSVVQVNMVGSATTKNIAEAFAVKFSPYLSGDFKYQVLLELHDLHKKNMLQVTSDLQGVAVNLPPPFGKTSMASSKINIAYYFGDDKFSRMVVDYDDHVYAKLALRKYGARLWQRLGGEIGIGVVPTADSPTAGIIISGKMDKLNWSVWRNYFTKTKNNFKQFGKLLKEINLHVNKLHFFAKTFKEVQLQAKPQSGGWEIILTTSTIKGKVLIPKNVAQAQIQGDFQRLDLGQEPQKIAIKPQDLPSLRFNVSNLSYNNKVLHNVELLTERQARGLQITKISIHDPQFNLEASGNWSIVGGQQQSVLRGKVSSNNVGELLERWQISSNLIGGQGEANFALRWSGVPYKPELSGITGSFSIKAKKGRIVNLSEKTMTKIGFGKVLNILSLKHLSLDFGGLTKKGFVVDKMQGDFTLAQGNILASNIMLDGSVALIKAHGRIGLLKQDYDIILSVTPRFTASVPVAATVAGGPVVGLLSWVVADAIIAPALKKSITYIYHITGSWDQPIVVKK